MYDLTNAKGREISLSPSALSDFKRCHRCFWLSKKYSITWPRGIFPSLPGGMDRVLKPWYDMWRAAGQLPPELVKAGYKGLLWPDQEDITGWRKRGGTALRTRVEGILFTGMIDDGLAPNGDKSVISVLDYKTRASAPKEGQTQLYYGTQADGYDMLFTDNGVKTDKKGQFVYFWPKEALQAPPQPGKGWDLFFAFETEVVTIDTSADRCRDLILEAGKVLSGDLPPVDGKCDNCKHINDRGIKINDLSLASNSTTPAATVAPVAAPAAAPAPVAPPAAPEPQRASKAAVGAGKGEKAQ